MQNNLIISMHACNWFNPLIFHASKVCNKTHRMRIDMLNETCSTSPHITLDHMFESGLYQSSCSIDPFKIRDVITANTSDTRY